jgi:hypothetical protein
MEISRLPSCSKGTCRSQSLPEAPKQNRRRYPNCNSHKGQNTVTPTILQRIKHVRCKKRETKASKGAQKRRGSEGTRRISCIRVDNVGLDTLERNNVADAEDANTDVGCDPVAVSLCGPAIDEKPNGVAECRYGH